MKSWTANLDRRRIDIVVALAALVLFGVLAFFAVKIADTQTTSRQRTVTRFRDRADLIAGAVPAVLSIATPTPATVRQYGGATVSDRQLDRAVAAGHLVYAALVDARGRIIARSRGVTPAVAAAMLSRRGAVAPALAGAPVALSDVLAGDVVNLAVRLQTPLGARILVSAGPLAQFSTFLGTYLRKVPQRSGTGLVIDSLGNVVASHDHAIAAGTLAPPALRGAIARHDEGRYGNGGYFASVPVQQTRWRVVLTQPSSALFYNVSGSRKWTPWILFATLGLVALGFLILLRRQLINAWKLAGANRQLVANNAKLESTNALLRHAAELTRSNAELEQFASIASHDLQEPLRKVQTFAAQLTTMERDRLSPDGQDYLQRMSNAASRMRRLIDDLLMFSRVSTRGRPFVAVDLAEVVAQVLIDLELTIEESGAQVSVEGLTTIDADPVQMRQLIQNLIANALKFRRPDVTPKVVVQAEVTDDVLDLAITDNGIGFDPQYAQRIFGAFERLHGVTDYPGTGIGLALCRKIVERHHGTIAADSTLGAGSVFEVRLPIHQPASAGAGDELPVDQIPAETESVHV